MPVISLERITGEGFLTFYNPFEFDVSSYEGETLQIDGYNKDDEMSKSNGSGKSSLLEAIGWGWYGELCRKGRYKDEVIYNRNGIKAKRAIIIITFTIGGEQYRTERRIEWKKSPELYIYDSTGIKGELLKGATYQTKQEHLEKILGMNFVAFQCCEMFGRDFMSFPDLKPAERSRILTDIRGLDRYVLASKQSAERVKEIQVSYEGDIINLKTIEGRILQLRETDYKEKIQEFEDDRQRRLEELQTQELSTKLLLKDAEKKRKLKVRELKEMVIEYEKTKAKNDVLLAKRQSFDKQRYTLQMDLAHLAANKNKLDKSLIEIDQEVENLKKVGVGNCPVCKQKITGKHLENEIQNLKITHSNIEAEAGLIEPKIAEVSTQIKTVIANLQQLEEVVKENENLQQRIYEAKTNVLRCEKASEERTYINTLTNLKDAAKALRTTQNPYKTQEEGRKATLFTLVGQSKDIKQGIERLKQESKYYEFWVEGFKKIRLSLFSTMIDRFQQYAQTLLTQYSSELQIQFSVERETRSGTVKDEFDIAITDASGTTLSYEMYSGGEKQKVRLSIAMALAQMIKDDCGKEFNFIAFDEPNDALDEVGKEVNFEVFTKLAMDGKAVLVTDHDASFKDKFDSSITVVKEDNKSHIIGGNQ